MEYPILDERLIGGFYFIVERSVESGVCLQMQADWHVMARQVIMKNLIIGAIKGYCWEQLFPFFESYKRCFKNCDCLMFSEGLSARTRRKLQAYGVILADIPVTFKDGCINNYRWTLIRDYLREHGKEYVSILSIDVRDAVFQKDLFAEYAQYDHYLGMATECDLIRDNECNTTWNIHQFGQEVYDKIKDHFVICSGTVWGTSETFLVFSEIMHEVMFSKEYLEKYPSIEVWDQPAMDFIIYTDLVNQLGDDCKLLVSSIESGTVMTTVKDISNVPTNGDVILNFSGEIPAVVHQYDRHRDLVDFVDQKYRQGIDYYLYRWFIRHIMPRKYLKRWFSWL